MSPTVAMIGRRARTQAVSQALAAALVLFVGAFCSMGVAPAVAPDAGCDGHHTSAKVCGQSGPSDPVLGLVTHASPAARAEAVVGAVPVTLRSDPGSQVQVAPSSPRAPPRSPLS